MTEYLINIAGTEDYENKMWNGLLILDAPAAEGACFIIYALFGPPPPAPDIPLAEIYDRTNGVQLDYTAVAKNTDILLAEGDPVYAVNPNNWIIGLRRLAPVTKQYTMKIITKIDAYIIQFDELEFLDGMSGILDQIGLDPMTYFDSLYLNGNPIEIPLPPLQQTVQQTVQG